MRISDWSSDVCSSDLPACLHEFHPPELLPRPVSSEECPKPHRSGIRHWTYDPGDKAEPVSRARRPRRPIGILGNKGPASAGEAWGKDGNWSAAPGEDGNYVNAIDL